MRNRIGPCCLALFHVPQSVPVSLCPFSNLSSCSSSQLYHNVKLSIGFSTCRPRPRRLRFRSLRRPIPCCPQPSWSSSSSSLSFLSVGDRHRLRGPEDLRPRGGAAWPVSRRVPSSSSSPLILSLLLPCPRSLSLTITPSHSP